MCVSRSVVSNSLRPHELQPTRLLCPWNSPGKNTGVGCHFLLQGISLTQGSNPGLPHCRQTLYCLSYQGSPNLLSCVRLFVIPWTAVYQASPSIKYSRQQYWSGLPFLSPGDLPNPGIKPRSPALQADCLPAEPQGTPTVYQSLIKFMSIDVGDDI